MKKIILVCAFLFSTISIHADFFGPSQATFTPKRCAGLLLIVIGGSCESLLGKIVLIGGGLALVTDNENKVTDKLNQIKSKAKETIIDPIRHATLEKINEKEKADPLFKNHPIGKTLKNVCQ